MKAYTCEYCEGRVRRQIVDEDFRYRGELILIQEVPVGVCDRCGSKYYPAQVLKKMQEIARNRDQIEDRIIVPVARFTEKLKTRSTTKSFEPLTPAQIRRLRGEKPREEFAREIGVSPQTLYRWELGKSKPTGLGKTALETYLSRKASNQ